MTNFLAYNSHQLKPASAWIAIFCFIAFSSACIVGHAGYILNIGFPVTSFAVGLFLYQRYPLFYLSFAWWILFITPLVRRLADYQSGWTDPSPILLSPLLVVLITGLTLLQHLPKSYYQDGIPFILCFVSVSYGFLVGVIRNLPVAVILELLGWITPILLGFHIAVNWRSYPSYRQTTQRTFLWSALVMGAYGVWQYLIAPEWDKFWLRNVDTLAFGTPEPLGIRVWSTMHSPQPFAAVMMAALLLLFSNRNTLRFSAAVCGYLSFLLSAARSAWLSWLVGLLIFLPLLKAHLQMRLLIGLIVVSILITPLIAIEPFSTAILPRLQSLSNTQNDTSYQDRASGYSQLLGSALSDPLGRGLGNMVESSSIGKADSGILTMLFSLGWLGTVLYLMGITLIFSRLLQRTHNRNDSFASAARSIALGTFAQIGLNVVMTGAIGYIFWGFLGISIAAQRYDHQQAISAHSTTIKLFG